MQAFLFVTPLFSALADLVLLVDDILHHVGTDLLHRLLHIDLIVLRPAQPDLSLDRAVARAADNRVVVFPVAGEPGNFFPGPCTADKALGGDHLPVFHGGALVRELSGNIFRVILETDPYLLRLVSGQVVRVERVVRKNLLVPDPLYDLRRVTGIRVRPVKSHILLNTQKVNGILQRAPRLPVLESDAEQFLDVIIFQCLL